MRTAKCQGISATAAAPRNFCCNFVNRSKSLQNTTNDNQRRNLSSSRRRTHLAENGDDTETGVRDLNSFVLNGTCGFDPHPGHFHFALGLVGLQEHRAPCAPRVPRLETVRVGGPDATGFQRRTSYRYSVGLAPHTCRNTRAKCCCVLKPQATATSRTRARGVSEALEGLPRHIQGADQCRAERPGDQLRRQNRVLAQRPARLGNDERGQAVRCDVSHHGCLSQESRQGGDRAGAHLNAPRRRPVVSTR